jgi:predicted transcriptional regulator
MGGERMKDENLPRINDWLMKSCSKYRFPEYNCPKMRELIIKNKDDLEGSNNMFGILKVLAIREHNLIKTKICYNCNIEEAFSNPVLNNMHLEQYAEQCRIKLGKRIIETFEMYKRRTDTIAGILCNYKEPELSDRMDVPEYNFKGYWRVGFLHKEII